MIISPKRKELLTELEQLQKEQITDICATFPTRLGRYVRIHLLRFILNTMNI